MTAARLKDWREMKPIVTSIYNRSSIGCCWHVVLDDGNVDSVDWVASTVDPSHADCVALVPLMQRASPTQRRKVAHAATTGRRRSP